MKIRLTPNQTLDLSPIGAIFRVVKTAGETNGKSPDRVWALLPFFAHS